jgi:hypothetical protein
MMTYSSSPSHRCDEFPAEYSSASCSPAELAPASPAALMLQPTTFVRRANLSERQPGNSCTVSAEGFTPSSLVDWKSPLFMRVRQWKTSLREVFLCKIPCPGNS